MGNKFDKQKVEPSCTPKVTINSSVNPQKHHRKVGEGLFIKHKSWIHLKMFQMCLSSMEGLDWL